MSNNLLYAILTFGGILLLAKKKAKGASPETVEPIIIENKSPVSPTGYVKATDEEIKNAFKTIRSIYGKDISENVEKIYRLETSHFKSGQFLKTGSPGMLKHSNDYPYGWTTMGNTIWKQNNNYAPIGQVEFVKGGKTYTYLVFRNFLSAAISLAVYLTKYPPERWYSTLPEQQAEYRGILASIVPRINNSIV